MSQYGYLLALWMALWEYADRRRRTRAAKLNVRYGKYKLVTDIPRQPGMQMRQSRRAHYSVCSDEAFEVYPAVILSVTLATKSA